MKKSLHDRRGTMMMEFVIVLPVFLLVLMGVAQFAHLWVAKHLTHYAAFAAARSALVHADLEIDGANRTFHDSLPTRGALGHRGLQSSFQKDPKGFRTVNMPEDKARSEVEYAANKVATRICAWVSAAGATDDGIETPWGDILGSASMDRKVRAHVDYRDWVMEVTVEHDFPMIFPIVGPAIGWLASPFDQGAPYAIQNKDDTGDVHAPLDSTPYPHIRFSETVRMPKPNQSVIATGNY